MSKIKLGVGKMPISPLGIEIMGDVNEWILIDEYLNHPNVENFNTKELKEIPNDSVEALFVSHLIEKIPHRDLVEALELWFSKLKQGSRLIIIAPDMEWICRQIIRFESGQILSGVYTDFEGSKGLQSLVYGTQLHEGECRKSCFTRTSLWELLDGVGYDKIKIEQRENEDGVGILLANCIKP